MMYLRAVSVVLLAGVASAVPAQEGPPASTASRPTDQVAQAETPRPAVGAVDGRHRIELRFGYADKGGASVDTTAPHVTDSVGADKVSFALGYGYWFRPELSVSLRVTQLNSAVESAAWRGTRNEIHDVFSVLVGLRRDFLGAAEHPRVRPYLTAGLGPYFGSSILNQTDARGVSNATRTTAAFGGQLGGGVDVQISRLVMLGLRADYDFMSDFSSPVGGRVNYSGVEAGVSLSFLFGRGAAGHPRDLPRPPVSAALGPDLQPSF